MTSGKDDKIKVIKDIIDDFRSEYVRAKTITGILTPEAICEMEDKFARQIDQLYPQPLPNEVLREVIAEKIYTDWNKDPKYTWKTLPEYRKQSYRGWVDEEILAQLPSMGELKKQGVRIALHYLKTHCYIQAPEDVIKEIEKACLSDEGGENEHTD